MWFLPEFGASHRVSAIFDDGSGGNSLFGGLSILAPAKHWAWLPVQLSAGIMIALGALHLFLTFRGASFSPRDPSVLAQLERAHPNITRQTTIWKAYIGFNASHSLGFILFGLLFGYLSTAHSEILFGSKFLCVAGLLFLLGCTALARLYWFSNPFLAITASTIFYCIGLICAWGA